MLERRRQDKARTPKRRPPTNWTLELMVDRLKEIQDYLGDRVPTYSEIYKDVELRETFSSCALAGAIHRFNQEHGIGSYNEFIYEHLGWIGPSHLTKEMAITHLERVTEKYGGVPRHVGRNKDLLGVRGRCLEVTFKKYLGMSVTEYCKANGIQRVPPT